MGPLRTGRTNREVTAPQRFWAKVDKSAGPSGCWLWTGGRAGKYGHFWSGRRKADGAPVMVAAHRWAYEALVGPVPEGLVLDHVVARGCTSRFCVNPAHLEPVTNTENVRRGRCTGSTWARGERQGGAKLTEEQVRDILSTPCVRGSGLALSLKHGVSMAAVSKVRCRKNWAHVSVTQPQPPPQKRRRKSPRA